jgi:integral membrane protein (TIGR01906 family)
MAAEMRLPWRRLLQVLVVILVPLVLVLSSVQMLAAEAYLTFEYGKRSFPADLYGFTPEERFEHARANLAYVRTRQPIEALAAQTHNTRPLYNLRELSHMEDVQVVFQGARVVWLVSLIALALAGLRAGKTPDTRAVFIRSIGVGGALTSMLVLSAGALALVAWQAWFQFFHQAFFQAGTWTFATSDTLIRLFPEKFWFDAALTVTGLSLAAGILLTISARLLTGTRSNV